MRTNRAGGSGPRPRGRCRAACAAAAAPPARTVQPRGNEWLYVLDGRLRLVLGDHDLTMGPGEAAEFDTRTPHWFGNADEHPVEFLTLFGQQGERAHLRAYPSSNGRRNNDRS
jgi:uncharacterized cupin superfamily protein